MPKANAKKPVNITKDAGGSMQGGDGARVMILGELLVGIRSEVAVLRAEILAELKSSISAVKTSLLEQEQKDVGESLTDVDGCVTALESMCLTPLKDNETLRAKLDDLENRSRGNNIRVIGIPERSEGTCSTTFIEALLLEVFGKESFSKEPEVGRTKRGCDFKLNITYYLPHIKKKEVTEAITTMQSSKAQEPDGFPMEFYKFSTLHSHKLQFLF
ncbi:hypothetical protein DPX16_22627 [Anabarilius grahami]|uniref:LINE-1 type transposase domain-containing protein 1 n=1 Tax=Anabarilius grahami TaxID=495550 RepID=A0A3N0XH31_ANAGA|nr:hypothetical protein DPX16_22627 [Anabarilius grahami]